MPFSSKLLQMGAAGAGEKLYIEDVFSTYLYTGNGSSQTITNGIDLSGEGGLTWIKSRGVGRNHRLTDTVRGATKILMSNTTDAESTESNGLTAFNNNGFSVGDGTAYNSSSENYASWTFRQAKKFFDVVTFTQSGTSGWQTVSHNLGSVPGCIIFKNASTTASWPVYHRYNAAKKLLLDSTSAEITETIVQNLTSTSFEVSITNIGNNSGDTFVAYLFAHDAGGFGDAGSDNVISCGSWTGNTSVNLGYEPQWILIKRTDSTSNWFLLDVMRGWTTGGILNFLLPNSSAAESTDAQSYLTINSTGFAPGSDPFFQTGTFIYIAIRRGPMKTPETGTSVFVPSAASGVIQTGFTVDSLWGHVRGGTTTTPFTYDRLRGGTAYLITSSTAAEATGSSVGFETNNGLTLSFPSNYVDYFFQRAPGFFDVVCYTGNATARTISHNLGVAPELIITKSRSGTYDWAVYAAGVGNTSYGLLNNAGQFYVDSSAWNNTSPTSSVFTVGTGTYMNGSGATYVAYLFASLSGVSKIGTYTGNGSSVTVTTNFQPRFILVKRTDSTGDWIVGDSARGFVTGNDPYFLMNSNSAEVTNEDWVDISSTSFTVNQTTNNANVNTATYIYLAIA